MRKALYFIYFFCYFSLNFSQIITYSGSYGVYGNSFQSNDIQYQMEFSEPLDLKNISIGLKWRLLRGDYPGLNVEGFGRWYTNYKTSYEGNSKFYVQAKIGYGLLRPAALDPYSSIKESLKFTPLFGAGIGYKFIIKERVSFDFSAGYHNQIIPKFNGFNNEYIDLRNKNWNKDIGSPVEIQWGIGFIVD